MMDSTAEEDKRTTSDVASIATAMNREEEINKYCREHEADLKRKKYNLNAGPMPPYLPCTVLR